MIQNYNNMMLTTAQPLTKSLVDNPTAIVPPPAPTPTPTPTPAPTPAPFSPSTATVAAFDPATQTVQGQIKGIIDANSPLMQQAETRSLQQSNSRGLINSSMAVGAGQAALYDAAMPIAASDASAYNQNQQFNIGQENQFKNASNAQGFDMAKMDKSFEQNKMQLEQKFGYDALLTKMQADSALETNKIQAQYKNLTQASASLTSIANNASDKIHQIMMNPDLDSASKQAAIDSYNANTVKSMQLVGAFAGDVDLSAMLDELLAPAASTTAPAFDAAAYLAANPDVAADPWASQNPEEHYNNNGKAEGRPLK